MKLIQGHFKIKEHPRIFLEPLVLQSKHKLPLTTENHNHDLSIYTKDISNESHHHISDDQVAAAVDAAIKTVPTPDVNCYEDAAATVDTVMNPSIADVGLVSVADATQAALAVGAPEHTVNDSDHVQV
jgi:hypothetical protein